MSSVYLFPYKRGQGIKTHEAEDAVWAGDASVTDEGHDYGRNLAVFPPNEAVRRYLAIRAYEILLNYNGVEGYHLVDGYFGWRTARAVKRFQREESLTVDGVIGPITGKALCFHLADQSAQEYNIPHHYLFGVIGAESSFDAACQGDNTNDRSLVEINRIEHSEVSDEQAYDPLYCFPWAAHEMRSAYNTFVKVNQDRAWDGAILYHHNPAGAESYVKTGTYSDPQFATYVQRVKDIAGSVPTTGSFG